MNDDKQTNLTDDLLADPFSMSEASMTNNNSAEAVQAAATARPKLSAEQEAKAQELASKIDVTKGETVLNYGADAQKQLGVFSQNMLTKVQSQDTGAVGYALTSLMTRLNEANPDELKAENNNIFRKLFGRVKRSIYEITAKYQKIGAQIDTIANQEKKIPQKWIVSEGNYVTQECLYYMQPLIMGEKFPDYENGLPAFSVLKCGE